MSVFAPASPGNGRTVYQGHLFVQDELLEHSPLRDHPLNPMRNSRLVQLLDQQSAHRAGVVDWQCVQRGPEAVQARLE